MCEKRSFIDEFSTNKRKRPRSSLNKKYTSDDLKDFLKIAYTDIEHKVRKCSFEGGEQPTDTFSHKPFKHFLLPDFIDDEEFLENLQQELLELQFFEKNNDLYKFHQSKDLKNSLSPCIVNLRNLLYNDFRQWLIDVTQIPLNDTVDMSCSKYDYTDVLLCHDDELEQRRIAFILYLVPEWSEKDGGSLDLFNKDDNNQPNDIVKSIFPRRNNLVFFEVSSISFHQVAEVISESKTRLSVSGWFYGPALKRPEPFREPQLPLLEYISIEEDMLYDWINPMYLNPEVQCDIKEKFESESEIQLQDFLKVDKFNSLKTVFENNKLTWKKMGPANKRWYYKSEDFPVLLKDCLTFLHSDALFLILSNMTGLRLHSLAPESESDSNTEVSKNNAESDSNTEDSKNNADNGHSSSTHSDCPVVAKCYSEVRKWNHGCYTLVHDCDTRQAEFALDSMLFFCCEDWSSAYGGYTSYIARDEDEELLTVHPTENSLALVYRDRETLKFVKHLNHRVSNMEHDGFYDIYTVYYE